MLLSVIIPVYNEVSTIREVVQRVLATGLADEVIVVDDGSTDGTHLALAEIEKQADGVRVLSLERNAGKGAAVRAGLTVARGDVVLIQDADLEYDPRDYPRLLAPIQAGEAAVVYGSRFLGTGSAAMSAWSRWANRLLTGLTNWLFGARLTDMETGYKVFRREALQRLDLRARVFEFEPEVTALLLLRGERIVEVPISFSPRSYRAGKKIRPRDALIADSTTAENRGAGFGIQKFIKAGNFGHGNFIVIVRRMTTQG